VSPTVHILSLFHAFLLSIHNCHFEFLQEHDQLTKEKMDFLLLLFIMKNSDEQRKIPYSFIIFFTRSNSLIYNG
jgi:hypothetical protein